MRYYRLIIFVCFLAVSYSLKHRIVGGETAVSDKFPYLVSLQWMAPWHLIGTHFCGGSIISRLWILSASHCIEALDDLDGSFFFIIAAGKQKIGELEEHEQRMFVDVYFKHENFNSTALVGTYDIALIKLSKPLKWNQWVKPIDLPEKDSEPTGNAIISGWGAVANFEATFNMPSLLHFKSLPIIDRNECNEAVEAVAREDDNDMKDCVHETDICTGPLTGGYSMCKGDSGGPLAGLNKDGNLVLIGISTWGMMPCGRVGAPSVYTRVSSFINWIHYIISVH